MKEWLTPFAHLKSKSKWLMIALQILIVLILWQAFPSTFFPKPLEIVRAWVKLMDEGMLLDIGTSLRVTAEAILITLLISLPLVYLTVFPWFRPWITFISKLRFNGLVGATLFFTLLASSGHELKLILMVFGTMTWFITAMAAEVLCISDDHYDLARTLGMSKMRTVYEVVVLGTADKAFEVVRQNAAIGWMMLSMVEGMNHSAGGMGALLSDQNKHWHLDAVFAIQANILVIGITLDYSLGWLKCQLCPYSDTRGGKL
jgi:NitT/TauT family transport system permease protein